MFSTITKVQLVSLELKTAVEFLEEGTIGNPFRRELVASFESLSCLVVESSFKCAGVESSSRIAVGSLNRIEVESLIWRGFESLGWRGLRIRRGRSAELHLLWEAMQVEPL